MVALTAVATPASELLAAADCPSQRSGEPVTLAEARAGDPRGLSVERIVRRAGIVRRALH